MTRPRLFCFGLGYTAQRLCEAVQAEGWAVGGTTRDRAKAEALAARGYDAVTWEGPASLERAQERLAGAHVLSSVAPGGEGDPVVHAHGDTLGAATWIGYLSATSVYGDHDGAWVGEDAETRPNAERGERRLSAEQEWLGLAAPVHVFRLAAIYGPGRSALERVRQGRGLRIPGVVISRAHVDDIVSVLRASMAQPNAGAIYNVADDEPSTPAAVTELACELLGLEPPPLTPLEELGEGMRSFFGGSKRVSNQRIRSELGVALRYPSYRIGLRSCLDR